MSGSATIHLALSGDYRLDKDGLVNHAYRLSQTWTGITDRVIECESLLELRQSGWVFWKLDLPKHLWAQAQRDIAPLATSADALAARLCSALMQRRLPLNRHHGYECKYDLALLAGADLVFDWAALTLSVSMTATPKRQGYRSQLRTWSRADLSKAPPMGHFNPPSHGPFDDRVAWTRWLDEIDDGYRLEINDLLADMATSLRHHDDETA